MRRSNLLVHCIMSIAIAACAFSCGRRETKLIPTSVIFGNPAKTAPQISPDAKRLSHLAPYNGVQCVYLLFPDEGHEIARPHNRMIFWNAAGEFLGHHLGGRYEESSVR